MKDSFLDSFIPKVQEIKPDLLRNTYNSPLIQPVFPSEREEPNVNLFAEKSVKLDRKKEIEGLIEDINKISFLDIVKVKRKEIQKALSKYYEIESDDEDNG